jgi:hypothetical protein
MHSGSVGLKRDRALNLSNCCSGIAGLVKERAQEVSTARVIWIQFQEAPI